MINNPLRQFFRRPAVFVRLPSGGKYYTPDQVEMPENGEIPVYPMTAIDDITLRTPDGLFNGTAIAELIKSCVPAVKDPWAVNNVDFDALLIAIRSASGESTLELESKCPKCEEESSYALDLLNVLAQMKSANYDAPLSINDMNIKFKPLTYKEMNQASMAQFEAQRSFVNLESITDENLRNQKAKETLENITNLTMALLSSSIDYIEVPDARVTDKEFILDFLKNCDKTVYVQVRDTLAELRSTSEIKPLKVKCIHCQHEYEQPFTLNTADFFG